jgi:hypothetical protein
LTLSISSLMRYPAAQRLMVSWTLVTALGGAAGWVIALLATFPLSVGRGQLGTIGLMLFGMVYGGMLGCAQSLVIRSLAKGAGWWVFATVVGEIVVWYTNPSGLSFEAFHALIRGLSLGISQWLVLRRSVKWAGSWIPATVIGQLLGEAVVSLLHGDGHPDPMTFVGPIVIQSFVGVVTGVALVFVSQSQNSDQTE